MEFSAIFHDTTKKYAYALEKGCFVIRLKTKKASTITIKNTFDADKLEITCGAKVKTISCAKGDLFCIALEKGVTSIKPAK